MRILLPTELSKHGAHVGSKGRRLSELMKAGFLVPAFVIIPSDAVAEAFGRGTPSKTLSELLECAMSNINAHQYAVRSNALIEDSATSSHAGQFCTVLGVEADALPDAVTEVAEQAREKLGGNLASFSIIIQEFREPDYAGVTFTRHPEGGRQMVVEWSKGRGDRIVGGEVLPERMQFGWNNAAPRALPGMAEAVRKWKEIDALFGKPQDVEWCVCGGKWFILQSRDITTITGADAESFAYLDAHLPHDKAFWYEKTNVSDITPRPTKSTLSLLKDIYGPRGPVERAYASIGVRYVPTDSLVIVGNELYVDREADLSSLFPAYTLFPAMDGRIRWARMKGLIRSLRNKRALKRLKSKDIPMIAKRLAERLDEEGADSMPEARQMFLRAYEQVFLANIYAEHAWSRLRLFLGRETVSLSELIAAPASAFGSEPMIRLPKAPSGLTGNGIELTDETPFSSARPFQAASKSVTSWWSGLSSVKRTAFASVILAARAGSELRELGRWVAVSCANDLKRSIRQVAKERKGADLSLLHHAALNELTSGKINLERLKQRSRSYHACDTWTFPRSLRFGFHTIASEPLGVSAGTAFGVLTRLEDVDAAGKRSGDLILYVPSLTPNLAARLDRVRGIVSQSGGMLSHLAIIARERGVPVVVNIPPSVARPLFGKRVEIDGSEGLIRAV